MINITNKKEMWILLDSLELGNKFPSNCIFKQIFDFLEGKEDLFQHHDQMFLKVKEYNNRPVDYILFDNEGKEKQHYDKEGFERDIFEVFSDLYDLNLIFEFEVCKSKNTINVHFKDDIWRYISQGCPIYYQNIKLWNDERSFKFGSQFHDIFFKSSVGLNLRYDKQLYLENMTINHLKYCKIPKKLINEWIDYSVKNKTIINDAPNFMSIFIERKDYENMVKFKEIVNSFLFLKVV